MPVTVILGTQWGDEGKGKIVDLLTRSADYVVRFQGGHNAGHDLGRLFKSLLRVVQRFHNQPGTEIGDDQSRFTHYGVCIARF